MDKVLEDKLFKKYPKLFRQENLSAQETCLWHGLECGNGWYFLIDNLCGCIQNYIDTSRLQQVEIVQLKEKFGMMRCYINGNDSTIGGMVWLAEDLSYNICEKCGTTANIIHTSGYVRTLCKNCVGENNGIT